MGILGVACDFTLCYWALGLRVLRLVWAGAFDILWVLGFEFGVCFGFGLICGVWVGGLDFVFRGLRLGFVVWCFDLSLIVVCC